MTTGRNIQHITVGRYSDLRRRESQKEQRTKHGDVTDQRKVWPEIRTSKRDFKQN